MSLFRRSIIAARKQSQPIILTQWKIVGNSEVHGSEIWSCGEYSATDGKYHIVVLPLGKSPVDIAMTEPLRKVNDVADTIEVPSGTEGKALVTRNFGNVHNLGSFSWYYISASAPYYRLRTLEKPDGIEIPLQDSRAVILCPLYVSVAASATYSKSQGIAVSSNGTLLVYDSDYNTEDKLTDFLAHINGAELVYKLATPTTELVNAPQIEEAESYSCIISQGAKAISWSSFTTE